MPQIRVDEPGNNSVSYSTLPEACGMQGPRLPVFVERSFPQLFEDQVERIPSKLAVVCGDKSLSFTALNESANQLARHLRLLGVGRESLVGICIDRSLEMAVGILGILKAGGAYLPLDPDYPAERLQFMIQDAAPSLVLTKSSLVELVPATSQVLIDRDWLTISKQPSTNLSDNPLPGDLAYVIYTSGSTGQPKGVMIEHGNLSNYLLALNHELEIQTDDHYLHLASIAFSSSRRQLMLPLSQGATVVIAGANERKDPIALFQMIKDRQVTVIDAVPSFWRSCTTILSEYDQHERRQLLDNKVRLMLSASEPLLADIPRTWSNDFRHPARHVHMFGQTETAGIVCINKISNEAGDTANQVPIGKPIANTEILVLDEHMRPCAAGVAGELYIGGAGVGRGYLNRRELTSEKFVKLEKGARFYRTGDWARVRQDGQLEFAGRRDQQIKLRGFRVELGEVEAAMSAHPAIREAVVTARDSDDSNRRLVAFFVPNNTTPTAKDLREFLGRRLPEYAIPGAFVPIDVLPLTANGKVDRLALSKVGEPQPQLTNTFAAPRSRVEEQLAEIWRELLRLEQAGIDDNFFELGGNSLLAGQVIARVRPAFKVDAPITWLFESPTVRELAARIDAAVTQGAATDISSIPRVSRDQDLPLSFSQHSLWFLDQLDPGNYAYNLGQAFEIEGRLDTEALHKALNMIVARHEVLRTRFVSAEGTPRQQIDLPAEIDWQLIDLESLPLQQRDSESRRLLEEELRTPFDLSTGPLLRARLVRLGEDRHMLSLTMHHIISDGWSAEILIRELDNFYRDFTAGQETSATDLPIQFADFAHWQRERVQQGAFASQLQYWQQRLADAAALNLPTDFPRLVPESYRGGKTTIRLSAAITAELKGLGRSLDATLFMTLLAAFNFLLARYSGQTDIVVGSPIAGRNSIETEPLIGFFVNTLPLRTTISHQQTVRDLLTVVRESALAAYANQDVPFEKLVSELQRDRDLDHHPIFQVMFVLQNESKRTPNLAGLAVKSLTQHTGTAKFDLALEVIDDRDGLGISMEYSTDLFAAESVSCMLDDFQIILESFVADPGQTLAQIPALTWQPRYVPEKPVSNFGSTEHLFVAPRTPIEEKLAAIWTEVLTRDRVGINDNFFALGGHSLMATQVIARIRSAFNYELPLRRLFETPTIAGLAQAICESQAGQTAIEEFAALMAELEGLSDDEALTRFAEEKVA